MKGLTSKILIALGIVLILAAILWWAIAVNAMVKIPDDLDSTTKYEGEMTYYVNPATQEPLPEGEEMKMPMKVERRVVSMAEEYDSSTALIKEEVTVEVGGMKVPPGGLQSVYALDRKSSENLDDDRAYDFKAGNRVNRDGSYYPLLPFDTSKDETYKVWKGEIGEAGESEFLEEVEKFGVTVYNFKGSAALEEKKEVVPAYLEINGLPSEVTFEALKPQLQALGVDVDGLLALAQRRLSPEDLQSLDAALQEKIPLKYYWTYDIETSVEPKTGAPVDLYKDAEAMYMEPDTSKLAGVFAILAKYANDPELGPALSQLMGLQSQLGESKPRKILEYSIAQTEETVKSAIDDAKDAVSKINLVKVYIPWALLIVGALLLIIGLLMGGGEVPEPAEG
ncbi:MAG: DUF3068 domain-containing protein [Actinobacteria bacterium]|nr:DUF3068 domain-containing protein [Actinomycetota bacterium]MDI6830128.1 porin PorA family protein [Actinomycetota bacterium]